jgi:hypothetical protein
MKFSHRYQLLKDIPSYQAGRTIGWHGDRQRFYFYKLSDWEWEKGKESFYLDFEGPSFTLEQAKDTEWFKPVGKEVDFIPPFPSEAKIDEYVDLLPDCHLVDDVDECRAINGMLKDKEFQRRLYRFFKEQYEAFYSLEAK